MSLPWHAYPGPMRRRGPRPLTLHLAHAAPTGASPLGADPALVAGIAAYRRHGYARDVADPPAIWAEGGSRLLDYGASEDDPAVLFVPSLVNRAHVLDLLEDQSMLRWLAASGLRPLLLDWGWPGDERGWTLSDYVAGRLCRAIDAIAGPLVLAGYCMGGLLAVAVARLRPGRVRALALLATPWDFHAGAGTTHWPGVLASLEPVMAATGTLPVDALAALLATPVLDATVARYRAFGAGPQDDERARGFVAMEDWAADGVPLAAPVAREVLGGWYGDNAPARGQWRIDGVAVDPGRLHVPSFVALPARDRIVPPVSAMALADGLPRAVVHHAQAGHVGMVAGPRAEAELWRPLRAWLATLP